MPLSQNPIPPQDTATAPVRLDAQMQKRIIARALELQQRQQDTLTPEQLEAVAAEAGIEATFVRQAVAKVAAERPAAQQWLERLHDRFSSDVRQHERAVVTGLGLAAVAGATSVGFMPDLSYGPLFIAAWLGGMLGGWKRAFQVGAAVGVAEVIAADVVNHTVHPQFAGPPSLHRYLFWMALCVGSSVLGAAVHRFGRSRPSSPAVGADGALNQG